MSNQVKCLLFLFIPMGCFQAEAAGSLAIDGGQGSNWGWAINFRSQAEADAFALNKCGNKCGIVLRFDNQCAAFAADQSLGSSAYGWWTGPTQSSVSTGAIRECRKRGGAQCRVRSWGCEDKENDKYDISDSMSRLLDGRVKSQEHRGQGPDSQQRSAKVPLSSLLLLLDISGSMSGRKLAEAKRSAKAVVSKLHDSTEIAILAFEGSCGMPIRSTHRFSQDASSLANFIDRLEAQGGTPLASAIEAANRYLKANASSTPSNRAIILLADGKANEGCDQITNVLDKLDSDVSLYKHETVGLEIDPFSTAASQLKEVASRTGGEYHHAANARSLDDSLDKAIQGLSLVKLIGQFE